MSRHPSNDIFHLADIFDPLNGLFGLLGLVARYRIPADHQNGPTDGRKDRQGKRTPGQQLQRHRGQQTAKERDHDGTRCRRNRKPPTSAAPTITTPNAHCTGPEPDMAAPSEAIMVAAHDTVSLVMAGGV